MALKQLKYRLDEVRRLKNCLDRLHFKLDLLNDRITSVKTSNISSVKVSGGAPVTLADLLADKEILETRIDNFSNKFRIAKQNTHNEIDKLDNVLYMELLELYFVECLSFDEIASKFNYSIGHTIRLYHSALRRLLECK